MDTCPNSMKRSSHAPPPTPRPAPEQPLRARREERGSGSVASNSDREWPRRRVSTLRRHGEAAEAARVDLRRDEAAAAAAASTAAARTRHAGHGLLGGGEGAAWGGRGGARLERSFV